LSIHSALKPKNPIVRYIHEVLNSGQEIFQDIGTLRKTLDCIGNSGISGQSVLFHLKPGASAEANDDTAKEDNLE
jgi:hypothetical protein